MKLQGPSQMPAGINPEMFANGAGMPAGMNPEMFANMGKQEESDDKEEVDMDKVD